MARTKSLTPAFVTNPTVLNPVDAELVATCNEPSEVDMECDRITRHIYVTEQRVFFLVESFFSFDGRLATLTKPVTSDQARAWCKAYGVDERAVDRYLAKASKPSLVPQWASLLTKPWGVNTPVGHTTV